MAAAAAAVRGGARRAAARRPRGGARGGAGPAGGRGGGRGAAARRGAAATTRRAAPVCAAALRGGHLSRDLGFGDEGKDVRDLQNGLAQCGVFPRGGATGYYGSLTRDAVRAFQTEHGLPPSGFWGARTREVFAKLMSAPRQQASELPPPGARTAAVPIGRGAAAPAPGAQVASAAAAQPAVAADHSRGAITKDWSGGKLMPAPVFAGACALALAVFGASYVRDIWEAARRRLGGRGGRMNGAGGMGYLRAGRSARRGTPPPVPPPQPAGLPSLAAAPLRLMRTISGSGRQRANHGPRPGVGGRAGGRPQPLEIRQGIPTTPQGVPLSQQGRPGTQQGGGARVRQAPPLSPGGGAWNGGASPGSPGGGPRPRGGASPVDYASPAGGASPGTGGGGWAPARHGGAGGGGRGGGGSPPYGGRGASNTRPRAHAAPSLPSLPDTQIIGNASGSGGGGGAVSAAGELQVAGVSGAAGAMGAMGATGATGPNGAAGRVSAVAHRGEARQVVQPKRSRAALAEEVAQARERARMQLLTGERSIEDALRGGLGGAGGGVGVSNGGGAPPARRSKFIDGFMPESVTIPHHGDDTGRGGPGASLHGTASPASQRSTRAEIMAEVEAARARSRDAMRTREPPAAARGPSTTSAPPARRAQPPARRAHQQLPELLRQRAAQQRQAQQPRPVQQRAPSNGGVGQQRPPRLASARSVTANNASASPPFGGTDARVILATARSLTADRARPQTPPPTPGVTDGRVLPPSPRPARAASAPPPVAPPPVAPPPVAPPPAAPPQAAAPPAAAPQSPTTEVGDQTMRIAELEVKLASLELALQSAAEPAYLDPDLTDDADAVAAASASRLAEEALAAAVSRYEQAAALGAKLASAEAALRDAQKAPGVADVRRGAASDISPSTNVDAVRSKVESLEGTLRGEMAELLARVDAAEAAAEAVASASTGASAESDMVAADLASSAATDAMRELLDRLELVEKAQRPQEPQPMSAETEELVQRLEAEAQRTAALEEKIAALERALEASAAAAPPMAPPREEAVELDNTPLSFIETPETYKLPSLEPLEKEMEVEEAIPAVEEELLDVSRWVPRWRAEEAPLNRLKLGREVILQGFHWESHNHPWYGIVEAKASDISKAGFTGVWMPPASHSIAPQGYLPSDLYCLDSRYGSESELRACLGALHHKGVNAYADIVINHRSAPKKGRHGKWNDYSEQRMGWGEWAIACTNESFAGTGNHQTGDDFPAAPNIDHTNDVVRSDLKGWLSWLRDDVGYDGWRFDFAKGYAGKFVGEYVEASGPTFSVGEYWDTMSYSGSGLDGNQDGHRQRTIDWVDQTGGKSAAFDFTTKGILQEAVRDGSYWRLADSRGKPAGVLGHWPARAVTFLDNHDTGSTQSHWPFPGEKVAQGYAYILTHPGMPCVLWDHFFDWGDRLRGAITELIAVRQRNCIDSRCDVIIDKADHGCYAARVGGRVAVRLGGGDWHPSHTNSGEWRDAASGDDWCVWERTTS